MRNALSTMKWRRTDVYATSRGFWAKPEAAKLLQQTLDEEGAADKKLTKLAEGINHEAMQPSGARRPFFGDAREVRIQMPKVP